MTQMEKISLSPPYTSTFDCGRLLAGLNGIRSHTVCHRCSNPQEAIVPKSHRLALFKNKGENKSSKDLDCFTFSGWKRWTSLVITNMLNIQIYYSFLEIKNIYIGYIRRYFYINCVICSQKNNKISVGSSFVCFSVDQTWRGLTRWPSRILQRAWMRSGKTGTSNKAKFAAENKSPLLHSRHL